MPTALTPSFELTRYLELSHNVAPLEMQASLAIEADPEGARARRMGLQQLEQAIERMMGALSLRRRQAPRLGHGRAARWSAISIARMA